MTALTTSTTTKHIDTEGAASHCAEHHQISHPFFWWRPERLSIQQEAAQAFARACPRNNMTLTTSAPPKHCLLHLIHAVLIWQPWKYTRSCAFVVWVINDLYQFDLAPKLAVLNQRDYTRSVEGWFFGLPGVSFSMPIEWQLHRCQIICQKLAMQILINDIFFKYHCQWQFHRKNPQSQTSTNVIEILSTDCCSNW